MTYEEWRSERWPPADTDTGRRAPWLSEELTGERLREITAYIRGVLTGDDLVEPDVKLAECGLSLLAGLLGGRVDGRLNVLLDDMDRIYG